MCANARVFVAMKEVSRQQMDPLSTTDLEDATAPLLSQEKGHFQHYVPHHNDCISMWCMLT